MEYVVVTLDIVIWDSRLCIDFNHKYLQCTFTFNIVWKDFSFIFKLANAEVFGIFVLLLYAQSDTNHGVLPIGELHPSPLLQPLPSLFYSRDPTPRMGSEIKRDLGIWDPELGMRSCTLGVFKGSLQGDKKSRCSVNRSLPCYTGRSKRGYRW